MSIRLRLTLVSIFCFSAALTYAYPQRNNFDLPPEPNGLSLLNKALLGNARTIQPDGQYVYMGAGCTFTVLNTVNPQNPELIYKEYLSGYINDICIYENTAYTIGNRLRIYDITDPSNPISILNSTRIGWGSCIKYSDGFLYINMSPGFRIVDIHNINSLVYKDSLFVNNLVDFKIRGDFAYLAVSDGDTPDGSQRLKIVDISNKDSIKVISDTPVPYDVLSIEVYENYVYISDWYRLFIYDISEKLNPILIEEFRPASSSLLVKDSTLYISTKFTFQEDSLYIFNISQPDNPQLMRKSQMRTGSQVFVSDNKIYTSCGVFGLEIHSINNEHKIEYLGSYRTDGNFRGSWICENLLFVKGSLFLHILDASAPKKPIEFSRIKIKDPVTDIYTFNKFLFVGPGISVYNIEDPSQPFFDANLDSISLKRFIQKDELIYALSESHLIVYNITDPMKIRRVGSIPIEKGSDIILNENSAVIATSKQEILFVDISTPEQMSILNQMSLDYNARQILINENLLYIFNGNWGHWLEIYDIADIQNPYITDSYSWLGLFEKAYIEGNLLYLCTLLEGIRVFNLNRIERLAELGKYKYYDWIESFSVSDNLLYVPCGSFGLHVLEFNCSTSIEQSYQAPSNNLLTFDFSCYPNPFNNQVNIQINLSQSSIIEIRIYDVLGKEIKIISNIKTGPGQSVFRWNSDQVSSGLYFVRVKAGKQSRYKKILLVR